MKEAKILFKYTTRSRPENFERGLLSILNNVSNDLYHVLVSVDGDDESMPEIIEKYYLHGNITFKFGSSTSKINAINRDLNEFEYEWDILVNFSDDMVFIVNGFDNIIRGCFDKSDHYLHFNDGNQKGNVSTMHIVGRKYYNRFKYIYHPDYISLWCDVENDLVAKKLGLYNYIGNYVNIFHHLHPAFGKGYMDDQYKHTESFYKIDEETFLRRKENNFDLPLLNQYV